MPRTSRDAAGLGLPLFLRRPPNGQAPPGANYSHPLTSPGGMQRLKPAGRGKAAASLPAPDESLLCQHSRFRPGKREECAICLSSRYLAGWHPSPVVEGWAERGASGYCRARERASRWRRSWGRRQGLRPLGWSRCRRRQGLRCRRHRSRGAGGAPATDRRGRRGRRLSGRAVSGGRRGRQPEAAGTGRKALPGRRARAGQGGRVRNPLHARRRLPARQRGLLRLDPQRPTALRGPRLLAGPGGGYGHRVLSDRQLVAPRRAKGQADAGALVARRPAGPRAVGPARPDEPGCARRGRCCAHREAARRRAHRVLRGDSGAAGVFGVGQGHAAHGST